MILGLCRQKQEDPCSSLAGPTVLVKVFQEIRQRGEKGRCLVLTSGIRVYAHTYVHMYILTCIHAMLPQSMHSHEHAHTQIDFCTNETSQANVQTTIEVNIGLKTLQWQSGS